MTPPSFPCAPAGFAAALTLTVLGCGSRASSPPPPRLDGPTETPRQTTPAQSPRADAPPPASPAFDEPGAREEASRLARRAFERDRASAPSHWRWADGSPADCGPDYEPARFEVVERSPRWRLRIQVSAGCAAEVSFGPSGQRPEVDVSHSIE